MNSVVPYCLLGTSALSRLAAKFQPAVNLVAKRWWNRVDSVDVRVRGYIDEEIEISANEIDVYQLGHNYLLFINEELEWGKAVTEWLGCNVDRLSPISRYLKKHYCEEIISSVCSSHESKIICCNSVDIRRLLAASKRPGAGAITIEITINNFSCRILTTAELFSDFLQRKDEAAKFKITNAFDALQASQVALDARLPALKIPIMQAANLAVGDFLDIKQDLSGEIILCGKHVDGAIRAELGRCADHKAAVVISECEK